MNGRIFLILQTIMVLNDPDISFFMGERDTYVSLQFNSFEYQILSRITDTVDIPISNIVSFPLLNPKVSISIFFHFTPIPYNTL